jgi:hypothetical protein
MLAYVRACTLHCEGEGGYRNVSPACVYMHILLIVLHLLATL